MTATYTFDVFSASTATAPTAATGGKQGPELLDHRLALYNQCSGWSSGPTRIARADAGFEHRGVRGA
jgi:hypothetical protein